MKLLHTLAMAAVTATFGTVGYAQTSVDHDVPRPAAMPATGMSMPMSSSGTSMAHMDEQMKAMQSIHDRLMRAKTPEQRSVLMAEHMKVMKEGMSMMNDNGSSSMAGMHQQMMEKRMQMMQSMMQMMMDRLPPVTVKP